MQFEPFESRRLSIVKLTKSDIRDYKMQLTTYNNTTDNPIKIRKAPNRMYLGIKNISGKLVGVIQVDKIDETASCFKIYIPNNLWKLKYGTEAVRQFIKCCSSRNMCIRIYPDNNSEIIKAYKKERPEEFELGGVAIRVIKDC